MITGSIDVTIHEKGFYIQGYETFVVEFQALGDEEYSCTGYVKLHNTTTTTATANNTAPPSPPPPLIWRVSKTPHHTPVGFVGICQQRERPHPRK
jgi:hypothetical protein